MVYYDIEGVTLAGPGKIDNAAKEAVDKKLTDALNNSPKFRPARLNGKPVVWHDVWAVELGYRVIVKDNIATLQYKEPQPWH